MSLFFANPMWWIGLLAVIPLAAHLFSRTRPRKRLFPSLVLLREAARKVTRVRRPRDRWLLLLRTIAMAAIALAFLQPLLISQFASKGGQSKAVLLLVDASASMSYVDGTRTRMTQATTLAEDLLSTLSAGSRANVIWLRGRAESVLPEPSSNLDFLKQALRQETAHPEAADIDGALDQAARQLAALSGERELVVISDFQRSAWQNVNLAPPGGIKLTKVAVGNETESNIALGQLSLEPPEPQVGQAARMTCRVRNLSAEARRVTIFGEAGPTRLSQSLEVGPWSESLAIMPVTFSEAGTVLLKASAGEDRYPGDDSRYALATVRGKLPVAIVGTADDAGVKLWSRAIGALDGYVSQSGPLENAKNSGAKIVFVSNWDGTGVEALRGLLQTGAALVVQPGAQLDATKAAALWADPGVAAPTGRAIVEERADSGWGLRVAAEEHPIFALFATGAYGDPAAGKFRRRVKVSGIEPAFRPLLTFDDGGLALGIRELALGSEQRTVPVMWWNLDAAASDWSTRSTFLPVFGEILQHLASFTHVRLEREFSPGDALRFTPDPAIDPSEVVLAKANAGTIKTRLQSGASGTLLASEEAAAPGSYEWSAQGAVLDRAVVNFPEVESDLRRMDAVALQAGTADVISGARLSKLRELREGAPIWPWCIAVAAACLLAEAILLRGVWRAVVATEETKRVKKEEALAA